MTDYSVTKNYPLDSVILWEKYLVYGAALGISLKALSQLPIDYSKAQSSGSGLLIYSYGTQGSTLSNVSSLSSLSTSLSSLSTSFSSYGAHGVGGSGGFSGGGGGAG
ncbi:hypothetical protein COT44_03730 [Candidatus Shapirobacteria bacterium CG08_land_8_20_14_0_20_39_18]|uniref:DUF2207 domain-containing protein n=1 Tax=Candidatus Shapirobacteria bacterium CG08_land_8_20_14_0_20_39_18 TaxID=1974883 RepID=A0A2M6XCG3_9BACT|nr:MAG: hypothetical protein COT44_03730 [Candidatus Shapirobacteria bacterium CG08_land_8_20_14_0_20_39_18]